VKTEPIPSDPQLPIQDQVKEQEHLELTEETANETMSLAAIQMKEKIQHDTANTAMIQKKENIKNETASENEALVASDFEFENNIDKIDPLESEKRKDQILNLGTKSEHLPVKGTQNQNNKEANTTPNALNIEVTFSQIKIENSLEQADSKNVEIKRESNIHDEDGLTSENGSSSTNFGSLRIGAIEEALVEVPLHQDKLPEEVERGVEEMRNKELKDEEDPKLFLKDSTMKKNPEIESQ
jgi:hypothetical protein